MKKLFITLFSMLSLAASSAPIIIDAPVNQLYAPAGFDNNDNVEVVVAGEFASLCFSKNTTEVKIDGLNININISAIYNIPGGHEKKCGQMRVPFKEVVALGSLKEGSYKIRVNQGTAYELNDKMKVGAAEINIIDEHIYANIEYIETTKDPKKVILRGHNPSDCLIFSRFEYLSNGKDTISVLPIMRKVSDFCPMKMTDFAVEATLDFSGLKTTNVLVHTRVMDGRSVNTILDLQD